MTLLLLAACATPAHKLFQAPAVRTYQQLELRDGDLYRRDIEERVHWTAEEDADGNRPWYQELRSPSVPDTEELEGHVGPEGLMLDRSRAPGDGWQDEPHTMIPARARRGEEWHEGTRHCTAERSPFCSRGLAVECQEPFRQTALVQVHIRHYCPRVGWVGEELGVFTREGGQVYLHWSEDVVIDGAPGPSATPDARGIPAPADRPEPVHLTGIDVAAIPEGALTSDAFREAYCTEPVTTADPRGLARVDAPMPLPPDLPVLALDDGWSLDGEPLEPAAVADTVSTRRLEVLALRIPADRPARTWLPTVETLRGAGVRELHWLVTGPQGPPPVVPEIDREIRDALAAMPNLRERVLWQRAHVQTRAGPDASDACPFAEEALIQLARLAPEARCAPIADAIDALWQQCPRQAPGLVTSLQVVAAPAVGTLPTALSDDAEPLGVEPDVPFGQVAATLRSPISLP